MRRIVVLSLVAALISGCARGVAPLLPSAAMSRPVSAFQASNVHRRKERLVIRIRIPKPPHRHGHYISPGTKGITIQLTGPSSINQSIALTPSDSRCKGTTLTCTIDLQLLAGNYTANVSTYDTAPSGGSIPIGAKLLSTAKNVPKTISVGKPNTLNLTLDGIAAAVNITGIPSATVGTAFAEAKAFSVTAVDASGYTIVGTYAHPITLADGDTSGATHIVTNTLLGSGDVAKLAYNGMGIGPASITASSPQTSGAIAAFAPRFTLGTSSGLAGTGLTETIAGGGFVNGSTNVLTASGITVSNVTVNTPTSLTAHFFIDPSASPGAIEVSVMSPGGTSGTTGFTISNTGVDVVTLATDTSLGSPPGVCPEGTSGELRYAMCHATAGDTIVFNTQAMCGSTTCSIALAAPLPPIQQNQTIDGGSFGRITIDGGSAYRAFWVDTGTVTLANLHVANASATGGDGANGNFVEGAGGGGAGLGAGLFVNKSTAVVTVSNDYFSNDAVTGGSGGNYYDSSAQAGGGGGGMGGSGAGGNPADPLIGGGGGGVLGSAIGTPGGYGGGGGGGAGEDVAGASGGAGYAGNSAGNQGGQAVNTGSHGGTGGFGGGGGGGGPSVNGQFGGAGAAGGFGGGGGGGADSQNGSGVGGSGGIGGAGGGGGAAAYGQLAVGNDASGGLLATSFGGGHGGGHGGGGGAAAGPDIFVNLGTLITTNSGATGSAAAGGTGGEDMGGSTDGASDATPVFNYGGTINASSTIGPIASALGASEPSARRKRF